MIYKMLHKRKVFYTSRRLLSVFSVCDGQYNTVTQIVQKLVIDILSKFRIGRKRLRILGPAQPINLYKFNVTLFMKPKLTLLQK